MSKPRRSRGDGSIYKRSSDGLWIGVLDMGVSVQTGKRTRKYVSGKTRKECAEHLRAERRRQELRLDPAGDRLTLSAYLKRWLAEVVKPSRTRSSYEAYARNIRLHITPALGSVLLKELTPSHVQSFLNTKSARYAPNTVRLLRATLVAALNRAVKWQLVERNAAALTDSPAHATQERTVWTIEQTAHFLRATQKHPLYAAFALALHTGMRLGEILGLRWEDVDLDAAQLRVTGSLQRYGTELVRTKPKTAASVRTVLLTQLCIAALRARRATQRAQRLHCGAEWVDNGLVFTEWDGTPFERYNLSYAFHHETERAGLPRIRFHDTRHSVATVMIELNISDRAVADQLGHSSPTITRQVYGHSVTSQREALRDALDEAFKAR